MAINAPEGTRDLLPDEALFWNQFKQTAAEVFGAYGYLPIETPIMEQTELFVRGIGEATDVVSKEMFTAISGEESASLGGRGEGPEGEEPPVLAPRGHGRCGARRSAARFGAAGRGPGEAHVRRPDVPRRAPAEGASAPVQSGGCGVPGRRGAYDRCRGHHHAHAFLREGGHPARFHAPSVELHGLRAVPSGLPRARCAPTWTSTPTSCATPA